MALHEGIVYFHLERCLDEKWYLLPKVPFKGAKTPVGIHPMFYLHNFRHDQGALQSIMMIDGCFVTDQQYLAFKLHASRPIGVSITATKSTRHEQTFECCKMQITKSFSFTPTWIMSWCCMSFYVCSLQTLFVYWNGNNICQLRLYSIVRLMSCTSKTVISVI